MSSTVFGNRVGNVLVALIVAVSFSLAGFGAATAATGTSVSVTPADNTASVGDTVTVDVRVDTVDNGIGSYSFNASVDNTSVAEITDVSLEGTSPDDTLSSVTYAEDGSSVAVSAGIADHDDGVIASITLETTGVGTTGVSVSDIAVGDDDANSYTVDSTNGATVTAVEQAVSVDLSPTNATVTNDGTTGLDVMVSNASDGVGSYDFSASVGNSAAATIENVSLVGTSPSGTLTDVTFAADGSNVTVAAASAGVDDGRIATIHLRGQSPGASSVSIDSATVGDSQASSYTISSLGSASVQVQAGPSPVVGNSPPADADGDGAYEDVNGDGTFNVVDVSALLQNRNSPAIESSPESFDFNGDGEFSIVDINRLLQSL